MAKATFLSEQTDAVFEMRAETGELRFHTTETPVLTLNRRDTRAFLSILSHFLQVVRAYEIIVREAACLPAIAAVREIEQVAWWRFL